MLCELLPGFGDQINRELPALHSDVVGKLGIPHPGVCLFQLVLGMDASVVELSS
jgi:hypothetical protein